MSEALFRLLISIPQINKLNLNIMNKRTTLEQELKNIAHELGQNQNDLADLNHSYNDTNHPSKLRFILHKTKHLQQKMNLLGRVYDRIINQLAVA